MPGARRILVFAEAVTLAHAARPFVVASELAARGHDVHLAWAPAYKQLFPAPTFRTHSLDSVSPADFRAALAAGRRLYDLSTLRRYAAKDRQLIRAIEPDVIIGDFRLSLSASARVEGVPYIALSNAYWSPYAEQAYPVPDLPLTRVVGLAASQWLFDRIRPQVFAHHARPLNRLRAELGLPALPADLRYAYTDADHTLYADIPGLTSLRDAPHHHEVIGPIPWSPRISLPGWWDELPDDRPVVYVNLGSSGNTAVLGPVLQALATLPVTGVVATAGAAPPGPVPSNCFVADYLPGDQAAAVGTVVVCNGGSPGVQQALLAARPVLGLAGNMDQLLNMQAAASAGAGILRRAGRMTVAGVGEALRSLLAAQSFNHAAARLQERARATPGAQRVIALAETLS
ncbi:nucleotide disphospho-sugar-binding domain-containing protein [Spiribacter halobius]|uniref:Glycosyl transferase family 1 n=1 Tax=Sediminicurvatus halobius TaxID=2182432 RepID=A0A2U2N0E1_9GAMM|nr:glycosyltransferase [Spiribacter halobius]PWG62705.1 glycosyl transferase family 1 [Spiribacter halobius]UEX77374.1 glycosyltransferase [Spiribacter halobius]